MTASARVWLDAARPRTLPAAVAPVLVGTALAEGFVAWRAAAALVVGLAFQVAVNFANDYEDGVRGVDTPDRIGPARAVASGAVAPRAMRRATWAAIAVAGVAGIALAAAVSWWLVVVGAACALAALGYSGGPRPYASAGLGEVFVFVCFGLVATAGSAFVQDAAVALAVWPAAVAMGLLASALLVVNNLRDVPTDEAVGKRTLAVRLGDRRSRVLYAAMVVGAFLCVPAVAVLQGSWLLLVGLAASPLAILAVRAVVRGGPDAQGARGLDLVPVLSATGRVQLSLAALVALGAVVAG